MMTFASAGDVVPPPPPSVVVPSLVNTNDVGGTASVAQLVKSVDFIILTLVVPSLYSTVRQQ